MTNDLQVLLDGARRIAQAAGVRIMEIYQRGFSVQAKDDSSPLTEADMAAHAIIDDGLESLTEHLPVLSEESADIPYAVRSRWDRYWLVDPLDGTREFVKRTPEFTVNIALIDHHRPILGVVYAPALQIIYYAAQGLGAFKQQNGHAPLPIRVAKPVHQPLIVASSRSHGSDEVQRFLHKVGEHQLIIMGSALKSCLVAEGQADIYPRLGLTSEWDTAAAQCVVEEAGGYVTDTALQPMLYNTKDSLLNPHFLVFGDNSVDWRGYL
ncbi:MAG: 3'(2'),5'-bisphosphate nucleotidase CysQ [Gammaproteobacteria bacterium]|nr:3'(2'),5'-bisphosphate nucleotidase CysQ [Gammaproteobacteria bacterium]